MTSAIKDSLSAVGGILPTPATVNPDEHDVSDSITEKPTISHELAMADTDDKGAAQQDHDEEVINLGWNESPQKIPSPLVGGLSNEDLWVMVRRFNKQTYHLKEMTTPAPGGLDLNVAEDEEFSPDKLRSNFERLYMTVIVGLFSTVKHIARLRSWRETRRTTAFCAAYTLAWVFDLIVPLLSATLVALILSPRARTVLFPPAPLALVSGKSGGVQKPKSGVLGSHDSVTGAPENHKGEAVEQEASNFVTGIGSIALSSAIGKHPQGDPSAETDDDGTPHDSVPDPTAIATGASVSQEKAAGAGSPTKDKTKVPMETAMWSKMRPFMHGLSDFGDTWERFGNALSPTPPFPQNIYRIRLAALVVPLLLTSLFVSSYMFMKGVTFGIGFGFFGDPIIQRGLALLNRKFPNWQKILELRNTVLKGIPTNAQLTITLLRIGEANKAPIPPPPHISSAPPDHPAEVTDEHLRAAGGDWPLNATKEELDAAMANDSSVKHETAGSDIDAAKANKHGKKGSKILGFFKGTAKATIQTAIGADSVKAKTGSEPAKNRLGVIPRNADLLSGPVEFKSRYHGQKGHVYITTKATVPCVAFSTNKTIEKIGTREREDLHPAWSVPVGDIKELKKVGGYGWKAKLVVGWAMGREVTDALEIVDRRGTKWMVTACPLRDELFNRLCAMGGQKWEAW